MSIVLETPDRTDAEIRAEIARITSAEARTRFNAALGKRAEIELRKHFASRPRNKRGWPSQGFYRRRIRNATALAGYDESGAEVRIADPAMNQKVYGGPIVPREAKHITLPARPEANGKTPRDFGARLKYIPLPDFRQGRGRGKLVGLWVEVNDSGFLRRTRGVSRDGRKTRLKVFFYALASVYQAPDPNALPSDLVMVTALTDETGRFFSRETKRGGSAR